METISGNPYVDEGDIRSFDVTRDSDEYVWHRDKEDRIIEILEGEGWQLQFDGCLPFLLEKSQKFWIPRNEYHRLLKGFNDLKIKIIRSTNENV